MAKADLNKIKMKKPKNIKSFYGGNWGPEGWYKFKVRFGDNWWKVASLDGWSDPWDLIEYNFGTRNPKEVNWYLANFVGCTDASPDEKNFIFSDNLSPGYIYTVNNLRPYLEGPVPVPNPTPVEPPEEPKMSHPGVYWGIGAKAGFLVGGGYDRVEAVMFSADLSDVYWTSIDTLKLGGGAGVGAGMVLVVASGLPSLGDLKYCRISGMDWNFSMGVKLKGLGKAAASMGTLRKLYHLIKSKSITEHALSEAASGIKYIAGTYGGGDFGNMPTVNIIDVPFAGISAEISLYSGSSTFSVTPIYESDTPLVDLSSF